MEIDGEGKVRIRIPWQVYAGLFVCVIVCIALIGLLYKEGSQPNIKISKDDVELQFPKEKSPPGAAIAATPAQTTPLNTPEDGKAVTENDVPKAAHPEVHKKPKLTQGGVRYYRELVIPQGDADDEEAQGKIVTKPCIPHKDWPFACDFALEADRMHAIVMPWDRHTR
jgi:hypothetical protein